MIASPAFAPPACAAERLIAGRIAYPPPRRLARFRRGWARAAAGAQGGDTDMDSWDRMEFKFGRLLVDDPKLTLAKIVERKSNPDASYLDVEKTFRKYKQKTKDGTARLPSNDVEELDKSSLEPFQGPVKSDRKLNLSRPLMKEGSKIKADSSSILVGSKSKLPESLDEKHDASNIKLRKPSVVVVDDIKNENTSELKIQPNLYLKMRKGKIEPLNDVNDITLLKKPQPLDVTLDPDQIDLPADYVSYSESSQFYNGQKPTEQQDALCPESGGPSSVQAYLKGKPLRVDPPPTEAHDGNSNDENHNDFLEINGFQSTFTDNREDDDWARVEELFRAGQRGEVELISCTNRGYVASFGSLLGFLPYRNLGTRWKFLAFESWLRKKGLDPSLYKKNFGIVESVEVQSKDIPSSPSLLVGMAKEEKDSLKRLKTVKLKELLQTYDQEKTKFLSSFIGQRLKVNVLLVNRNSRKLLFSGRPREREDIIEKKSSLMAKLRVGDVVKCQIKKITYFGIFVEVEGVPALIHQSEVSWDASIDPSLYYKIGQIVEAKVLQLDFALERITLSLKEITPDPLVEALESVVGDHSSMGGNLLADLADSEWPEVEALINELQQIQGINSVSKGRFFLSPGQAPTFQVYLGSTLENQYKLLARAANKVQEVMVQASLDKDQMKAVILTCTNRVE